MMERRELMSEELDTVENENEESLEDLLDRINNGDKNAGSFTISSEIGKDDYRAFLYYSVLGKNKLFTAAMVVLPAALTFYFNINDGKLMLVPAIVITCILWLLIFGAIIFRTERSLKKIGKNSPDELRLTKTEYKFVRDAILHTKNGKTTRVPYSNFTALGKTKKRFFLYFQGGKGMIIRCEDIVKVKTVSEFERYLTEKIYR